MTRFFDPIAQEYRDLNLGKHKEAPAASPVSQTNSYCTRNGHDFDPVTSICRRCQTTKAAWQVGKNAGVTTP